MSDGGAAVIVEVGSLLARSKAGRVVLFVLLVYAGLQYVLAELAAAAGWALGVIGAGLVGLAIVFFVRRRRRRAARTSLLQAIALVGLVLVASAAAVFVLVRRRREGALPPPPEPDDIDRLAAQEGA